jgi:hypothetical protein
MDRDNRNYDTNENRSYPFGRAADRMGKPNPTTAIIREIDFTAPGNNDLYVYYSRYTKPITVIDEVELRKILISVYDPGFPYDKFAPMAPEEPFDSQLSLNNDELRYIIFRLKAGKNWQFAREGWPITIGDEGKNYFYEAHRVDRKGIWDKGDDRKLIRDGCQVAYVIAAADEVLAKTGAYCHPINLHIDLIHEVDGLLDGKPIKKTCYLPLIVDPDVRYPGGSGVDGGGKEKAGRNR